MSDKRRGKAQTTKAPPRQRTLLDSFIARVPSKTAPPDSVAGNMLPPATTDSHLAELSNKVGDSLGEETNNKDDLRPEENGRRSPSIVIIGDTPEPPAVLQETPLITPQDCHANGIGRAKDLPIIIDGSPVQRRLSLEQDKKPIHPFFLPKSTRAVRAPQKVHSVLSEKKAADTAIPLNPSLFYPRGIPQHVRGVQTAFTCSYSPLPTRPHACEQATEEVVSYDFLESSPTEERPSSLSHRVQLLPIYGNDPANGIPEEIKGSYPAVARLIDLKPVDKPTSNRPWADKWRPSCAHEVLGNEQSAIYLRDWLCALELQLEGNSAPVKDHRKVEVGTRGIKRPRVIRAVDKSRRKRSRLDSDDDEDNWIVDTDDEEEEMEIECDQFDEFGEIIVNDLAASSPSSSVNELSQRTTENDERSSYLGQLHNTILLTGPPGCGKTASVYACAEELGWDVFEVYPGIGRRNAANIENLIGEVGKNHLVLQSRASGDSLKSFLQSKGKWKGSDDSEEYNALSQISPRKKSSVEKDGEVALQDTKSVQQSLILLEEVDILFKEDTNFWTTVTKIIRECKRPVVCTCNDLSLVPVQDLPLQATLLYTPCPEGPAACYLQLVCAAEGYAANWNDLLGLYSQNGQPDLRGTINALQAISAAAQADQQEKGGSSPLSPARISVGGSDILSFLDGSLDGNMESTFSALADLGNHVPCDDDETGHAILFDRHGEDGASMEICDRQREILSAAARLASRVYGMDAGTGRGEQRGEKIREGQRAAAREICRMADAGAVTLEYLPYVRQIVAAEDGLEQAGARRGQGRRTRNSMRYVRMVELTAEARAGVGMGGLVA